MYPFNKITVSYYFPGLHPESAMEKNLFFKCLLNKPCNKILGFNRTVNSTGFFVKIDG